MDLLRLIEHPASFIPIKRRPCLQKLHLARPTSHQNQDSAGNPTVFRRRRQTTVFARDSQPFSEARFSRQELNPFVGIDLD